MGKIKFWGIFFILIAIAVYLWISFAGESEIDDKMPEIDLKIEEAGHLREVEESSKEVETIEPKTLVNKEGQTIEERYKVPDGFTRIEVDKASFGTFLREQKLKPYGEKALFYNGSEKRSDGIYDSVLDVNIGDRDLHQCADAVMLLRAEYFYNQKAFDQIGFHFVNGFYADFDKWSKGYRIDIDGNNTSWVFGADSNNDYETFRKYMDMVFAYASTLSLEKELIDVPFEEMSIGDVLIQAGSPGHAVIVVDMAENKSTGEKLFMLAQSYMPAQQTQILINPNDSSITPWYALERTEPLITPQWQFEMTDLKRFPAN